MSNQPDSFEVIGWLSYRADELLDAIHRCVRDADDGDLTEAMRAATLGWVMPDPAIHNIRSVFYSGAVARSCFREFFARLRKACALWCTDEGGDTCYVEGVFRIKDGKQSWTVEAANGNLYLTRFREKAIKPLHSLDELDGFAFP